MNRMGYRAEYGKLLEEIANEADEIAMRHFRDVELRIERKKDGTAVTEADKTNERITELSGAARSFLAQPGGAEHFQEARALLEVGIARLAAQRCTDDDIVKLRIEARKAHVFDAGTGKRIAGSVPAAPTQ